MPSAFEETFGGSIEVEGLAKELDGLSKRLRALQVEQAAPSGLQWEAAGTAKPAQGKELANDRLSAALQGKTEFTQREWRDFGVKEGLTTGHFVKAGDE